MSSFYDSPNGKQVETSTSLNSLLSDDFGGTALRGTDWTVYDGGLSPIGTGTTGITDAIANSALTVSMGTTNGAERWYLSNKVFAGKEDILVVLNKSQPIAANSIFVGLIEVDPTTFIPIQNPLLATDFQNRGGVEFGLTTTTTAFQAEALGDGSAAKASGNVGVAGAVLTTTQEYLIEIDSRDIIVSNSAVDSVAAKAAGSSRVSTQVPNDQRVYKLILRFKNVSAPATNTNVVIQRILVVDNYEQRVQISSAEGDQIGAKAMAVNIVGSITQNTAAQASTALIGDVGVEYRATSTGGASPASIISPATAAAAQAKGAAGRLIGWSLSNSASAVRSVKIWNTLSASVTLGTTAALFEIDIPPGGVSNIILEGGIAMSAAITWAVTAAKGLTDNTSTGLALGDVSGVLIYA